MDNPAVKNLESRISEIEKKMSEIENKMNNGIASKNVSEEKIEEIKDNTILNDPILPLEDVLKTSSSTTEKITVKPFEVDHAKFNGMRSQEFNQQEVNRLSEKYLSNFSLVK